MAVHKPEEDGGIRLGLSGLGLRRKSETYTFPLTGPPAFCNIVATSSSFGADLNFMQSG
jgi:hypothetical protein